MTVKSKHNLQEQIKIKPKILSCGLVVIKILLNSKVDCILKLEMRLGKRVKENMFVQRFSTWIIIKEVQIKPQ